MHDDQGCKLLANISFTSMPIKDEAFINQSEIVLYEKTKDFFKN